MLYLNPKVILIALAIPAVLSQHISRLSWSLPGLLLFWLYKRVREAAIGSMLLSENHNLSDVPKA